MFLNNDQKQFMKLIEEYGCLREKQLEALITAENKFFKLDVAG